MSNAKLFFGGAPVAPDVSKLIEHFGITKPGDFIPHEQVETALGLDRKKNRYRTVTKAWCDALWEQHNVRQLVRNGGFETLNPEQRMDYGEYQRTKGVRRITQAVKEIITTPTNELDDRQQRRHTNLLATTVKALGGAKEAQKEYGRALAADNVERLPHRPLPE